MEVTSNVGCLCSVLLFADWRGNVLEHNLREGRGGKEEREPGSLLSADFSEGLT